MAEQNSTACLVFDFDGVLVESNSIKRNAYGRIFKDRIQDATQIHEVLNLHPEADRIGTIRAILSRFGPIADRG